MDFLRRGARKSKLDRVRNEEIRRTMKRKETIVEAIRQKQLVWFGHLKRMDEERLPKILMEWLPTERRKRGRPRETWKQGISKAMSERNLGPGDWNDREEWKLGIGRRPHTL
ncbi:uncharacterized protein LOC124363653 [Homalodisca vitripennis]|uniref:uncharacterized protein LOC124363653 n=1 Tax=Homalodisca vitripennis TaxID=197043 RepID=UPI001EEB3528|nr:uncharacterized protein LOC124363653 [Homalodisca vitripennis]